METCPAIKIGRLAVHKDFQSMHIGSILIDWVVGFCLEPRKDIGVRFISVDAYNREKTNIFIMVIYLKHYSLRKTKIRIICRCRVLCQK